MHNVHHNVVREDHNTDTTENNTSNTTPNIETITESNIEPEQDTNVTSRRPRWANVGVGIEMFEPTLGGKEHFSYRKKCMLQRQRKTLQRKPLRSRIT